ncbi:PREDICTED: uncharacterized protein LOC107064548 [Polistes dominula]|uniref:Uncharacterized protein LOC107064548 n=1 Tax=Polistes dominula TaxID=743375 RepID=A0ABM1HXX9_POLDO|nr:PREDICTED: uncharacterized protein LOC107064548 [Polistes dominula]
MDCLDDDALEFSDKDENSILNPPSSNINNPIEEYLKNQLSSLQNKVDKTNNELEELKDEIKNISNSLIFKLVHGHEKNSDSDSEMYTIKGEPVIQKRSNYNKPCKFLILKDHWQYVYLDKWIIVAILQNVSFQTLRELKFYAFPKDMNEIHGVVSAFWQKENELWKRIDVISPRKKNIVATLVLDPIDFHENTVVEIYSTISYENLDTELQIAIPVITFYSRDILRGKYDTYSSPYAVLAFKSISLETILDLPFELDSDRFVRILQCLDAKSAGNNIYVIEKIECHAMIETLSSNKISIMARTMSHLKLILSIIQEEASIPITRLEEDRCVEAAEALIEELETYLGDLNFSRMQRARIKSDLLIP